jgi:hypothetical protein
MAEIPTPGGRWGSFHGFGQRALELFYYLLPRKPFAWISVSAATCGESPVSSLIRGEQRALPGVGAGRRKVAL